MTYIVIDQASGKSKAITEAEFLSWKEETVRLSKAIPPHHYMARRGSNSDQDRRLKKMKAWIVTLDSHYLDTVFFEKSCDREYVRLSLINHDGYSPNIRVEEEK